MCLLLKIKVFERMFCLRIDKIRKLSETEKTPGTNASRNVSMNDPQSPFVLYNTFTFFVLELLNLLDKILSF